MQTKTKTIFAVVTILIVVIAVALVTLKLSTGAKQKETNVKPLDQEKLVEKPVVETFFFRGVILKAESRAIIVSTPNSKMGFNLKDDAKIFSSNSSDIENKTFADLVAGKNVNLEVEKQTKLVVAVEILK